MIIGMKNNIVKIVLQIKTVRSFSTDSNNQITPILFSVTFQKVKSVLTQDFK